MTHTKEPPEFPGRFTDARSIVTRGTGIFGYAFL